MVCVACGVVCVLCASINISASENMALDS